MTPVPAETIAQYYLAKAREEGMAMTPMKLQKLVYLAQGWYAALRSDRLIAEEAQAWDWGPVFPSLYHRYKIYGRGPIDAGKAKKPAIDPSVAEIVDDVWEKYARYSAYQLSDMTHRDGTPWEQARQQHGERIRGLTVPFENIRHHFNRLLQQSSQST